MAHVTDGGEVDVEQLARFLFRGEPRGVGTVMIDISELAAAEPGVPAEVVEADFLMQLFVAGIAVRYGDQRPESLTGAQLDALRRGTEALGYTVRHESDALQSPPDVVDPVKEPQRAQGRRFYDFERGLWHYIWFERIRAA